MSNGVWLLFVSFAITVVLCVMIEVHGKRFAKRLFPLTLRLLARFKEETLRAGGKEVFLVSKKYREKGNLSIRELSRTMEDYLCLAEIVPRGKFINKSLISANMENVENWEKGVVQVLLRELEENQAHFFYSSSMHA